MTRFGLAIAAMLVTIAQTLALDDRPAMHDPSTAIAAGEKFYVYATGNAEAPRDIANGRLAIGSNAASIWWLNGQEVIGIYNDRQTVIDDGVSKRLTLKKGPNVVRAAVINGGGATDFCARFLDADEKPLQRFTVSVNHSSN